MAPTASGRLGRFVVALLAGGLLGVALGPARAHAEPVRLRVTLDPASVEVGGDARVVIELLDRDARPIANDRDRIVALATHATGAVTEGAGDLSPARVRLPAGVARHAEARFTGRVVGAVLVRATSQGLAPGQDVARVVSQGTWASWLFPVLHAQPPTSTAIIQPRSEALSPVPLNRTSTPTFRLLADRQPSTPERRSYRIVTEPAVRIRYGDTLGSEGFGVATLLIPAGSDESEPFEISGPDRPARVLIRARSVGGDLVDEVHVTFVAPQPVQVGIEPDHYDVSRYDRSVPLQIRLLDSEQVPLQALARPYDVELDATSGTARLEPRRVSLSANNLGNADLRLPGLRLGSAVKVVARGEHLVNGEATFMVSAATAALVAMAIFAGFLGGLVRHVWQVRTPHVWFRRVDGHLEPGLLGNALLSGFSGLLLYLAADISLIQTIDPIGTLQGSARLAFVLGAVGGFAGVLVFETLSDRVLPGAAAHASPSR